MSIFSHLVLVSAIYREARGCLGSNGAVDVCLPTKKPSTNVSHTSKMTLNSLFVLKSLSPEMGSTDPPAIWPVRLCGMSQRVRDRDEPWPKFPKPEHQGSTNLWRSRNPGPRIPHRSTCILLALNGLRNI